MRIQGSIPIHGKELSVTIQQDSPVHDEDGNEVGKIISARFDQEGHVVIEIEIHEDVRVQTVLRG